MHISDAKQRQLDGWRHLNYPNLENCTTLFDTYFSHTYDLAFYESNSQDLFLTDGILGTLSLLNAIKFYNSKISTTFNLPIELAPLIPNELRKKFNFYKLNQKERHMNIYDQIFIGIPTTKSQISIYDCIQQISKRTESPQIINLIHPLFDNNSVRFNFYDSMTLEDAIELKSIVQKFYPNSQVQFISFDQFLGILTQNSLIIDSNSKLILTNQTSLINIGRIKGTQISDLTFNQQACQIIKNIPLIQDNFLTFYKYEGECILASYEHDLIGNFALDNFRTFQKKYLSYSSELYQFTLHLANKLYIYHQRNIHENKS